MISTPDETKAHCRKGPTKVVDTTERGVRSPVTKPQAQNFCEKKTDEKVQSVDYLVSFYENFAKKNQQRWKKNVRSMKQKREIEVLEKLITKEKSLVKQLRKRIPHDMTAEGFGINHTVGLEQSQIAVFERIAQQLGAVVDATKTVDMNDFVSKTSATVGTGIASGIISSIGEKLQLNAIIDFLNRYIGGGDPKATKVVLGIVLGGVLTYRIYKGMSTNEKCILGVLTFLLLSKYGVVLTVKDRIYRFFFDNPEMQAEGLDETDLSDIVGSLLITTLGVRAHVKNESFLKGFKGFKSMKDDWTSIFKLIVGLCQRIMDTVSERYGFKHFSLIGDVQPRVEAWQKKAREMFSEHGRGQLELTRANYDNINSLVDESNVLLQRLGSMRDQMQSCISLRQTVNKLERVIVDFENRGIFGSKIRQPPVSLMFSGVSQIGKSRMLRPFVARLLARVLKGNDLVRLENDLNSMVYSRQTEQEFWDGYFGQTVCFFDEFDVVPTSKEAAHNAKTDFLRCAQVFANSLHMASLEQKGNTYFRSKIIMCTSNAQDVYSGARDSVTYPEAIVNRFDFECDVRVKPEYATEDSLKGKPQYYELDKSKLPSTGEFVWDIWNIFLRKRKRVPGGDFKHEYTLEGPYNVDQILEMCVKKYKEKENIVEAMLRDDKRAITLGLAERDSEEDIRDIIKREIQITRSSMTAEGLMDSITSSFSSLFGTQRTDTPLQMEPDFEDYATPEEFNFDVEALEINLRNHMNVLKDDLREFMSMKNFWRTEFTTTSEFLDELAVQNRTGSYNDYRDQYIAVLDDLLNQQVYHTKDIHLLKLVCILSPGLMGMKMHPNKFQNDLARWLIQNYSIDEFWQPGMWVLPVRGDLIGAIDFTFYTLENSMDKIKRSFYDFFDLDYDFLYKVLMGTGVVGSCVLIATLIYNTVFQSKMNQINMDDRKSSVSYWKEWRDLDIQEKRVQTAEVLKDLRVSARVEAESYDPSCEEILKKVWMDNFYSIHWDDDSRVGFGFFTHENYFCFPAHFIAILKEHVDGDFVELRSVKDDKVLTVRTSTIYGAKTSEDDLAYVRITNVRNHPDIRDKILYKDYFTKKPRGELMVPTIDKWVNVRPTNYDCLTDAVYGFQDEIIKLTKALHYRLPTRKGMCGLPLFVVDSSTRCQKLCGVHVAGNAKPHTEATLCYGTVFEKDMFSTRITMEAQSLDVIESTIEKIGEVPKPPGMNGVSSIRKSDLYGGWGPAKEAPARLSPFMKDGVRIYPMQKALDKFKAPIIEYNPEFVRACVNSMVGSLFEGSDGVPTNFTKISLEDAVLGVPGRPFYDGIPRSTSCGYPYNTQPMPDWPGKTRFLGKDVEPSLSGPCWPELEEKMERNLRLLEKGIRPEYYYTGALKDERRPLDRVAEGKTRYFSGAPIDYCITFKEYFQSLGAYLIENRITNGFCVGVNPFSAEWDVMGRMLLKGSSGGKLKRNIIAGDFSGFDVRQSAQILGEIGKQIVALFSDSEYDTIRLTLWQEVVNSRHIVGKGIYSWKQGMPSGHPWTTLINCMFNATIFRMAWVLAHDGDLKSLLTFKDHVTLFVYGDDNIASLSDYACKIFNQSMLTELFDKIGMIYTSELKSEEVADLRTLAEVEFLKRGFRYEPRVGRIVAPLRLEKILEIPYWTKKDDPYGIMIGNLITSIRELSLHDHETFDKWTRNMLECSIGRIGFRPSITDYDLLQDMVCEADYTF